MVVNFSIYGRVSSVKHLEKDRASAAGEGGEVEVMEMEEESTNRSRRFNNEEEDNVGTSDVNSIDEDFVDQAADDPDVVDEEETQSNDGQNGLNNEEVSAGRDDINCNAEHAVG